MSVVSTALENLTKIQESEPWNEQEMNMFHSSVDKLLWVAKIV